MEARGLSARRLSLDAGLNESAVKAILAGKSRNPRSDTLGAIAGVLGCTVNDLLGAANGAPQRIKPSLSSSETERLVEDAVRFALDQAARGLPNLPRKKGRK